VSKKILDTYQVKSEETGHSAAAAAFDSLQEEFTAAVRAVW